MRKMLTLISGLTLALSLAWGAEDPTADHVKWMKDLGSQMGAIRKGADVAKNAEDMQATLKLVGAWWKAKDADAAKSCSESFKGAQAIADAAKSDNKEGIAAGMKMVGAGCKGCHDAHREKVDEHTYKIK